MIHNFRKTEHISLIRLFLAYMILALLSIIIGLFITFIGGSILAILIRGLIQTWITPFAVGVLGETIFIPLVMSSGIAGVMLGITQPHVVYRLIHRSTRNNALYVLFSSVGWCVGLLVVTASIVPLYRYMLMSVDKTSASVLSGFIVGAAGGLIVGLLQGLVLQGFRHIMIWVVANILSWALVLIVIWAGFVNIFSNWGIS